MSLNKHNIQPINSFLLVVIGLLLFTLSGCIKQDFPEIEDITKGSKWNLNIGDQYEMVYEKLQELGIEKDFQAVAVVGRTAFDDTEDAREFLPYYNWLGFQNVEGRVDRVLIGLDSGRVNALYGGGAMLDSLISWPDDLQGEAVIQVGDTFDQLIETLGNIQMQPDYRTYHYLLPDKPLGLPLDPDMKNFGQWFFTFVEGAGSPGVEGRSQVTLYFEDDKLARINHVYNEYKVTN